MKHLLFGICATVLLTSALTKPAVGQDGPILLPPPLNDEDAVRVDPEKLKRYWQEEDQAANGTIPKFAGERIPGIGKLLDKVTERCDYRIKKLIISEDGSTEVWVRQGRDAYDHILRIPSPSSCDEGPFYHISQGLRNKSTICISVKGAQTIVGAKEPNTNRYRINFPFQGTGSTHDSLKLEPTDAPNTFR